jgi:hypothetical protein
VKTKYLSMQFKQFALSSVFIAVAAIGLSVSNSFDQEYMAKVVEQERALEKVAASEKELEEREDEKTGVAMK